MSQTMAGTEKPGLFTGLGPRGVAAVIVLFLLLGIARLAILVVPFRRLAGLLGTNCGNTQICPLVNKRQRYLAWKLGLLVRRVADRTPWESKCLAQALVTAPLLYLMRVPYVLYLGVAKEDTKELRAHAWVRSGPCMVTGGAGTPEFTVVATFVSPLLAGLNFAPSKSDD